MHEIFNYTVLSQNETFVRLHHRWINSTADDPSQFRGADLLLSIPTTSSARLSFQPGNNGTFAPPTIGIITCNASNVVRFAVVTNETSLVGLNPHELFLSESANGTSGLQTTLRGLANGANFVANEVSFHHHRPRCASHCLRPLSSHIQTNSPLEVGAFSLYVTNDALVRTLN